MLINISSHSMSLVLEVMRPTISVSMSAVKNRHSIEHLLLILVNGQEGAHDKYSALKSIPYTSKSLDTQQP